MASLNLHSRMLLVGIFALTALIASSGGSNPLSSYEVLFGWKVLDYKWPSPQTRERLLETKEFIPENNIITGVKVFGDNVYITVPRWRAGIPSTLNVVKMNNQTTSPTAPVLVPYPSWEMNQVGNCNALQFTQSMEIDEFGRMWIIDVGSVNIFTPEAVHKCPAKLIIIDIEKNEVVRKFEFPPEVVSNTNNFLNDIVVGCDGGKDKCWAYISDARDAKLVVYNLEENKSWFVHHKTMVLDSMATNVPIFDGNYTFTVNIDGIALSPKDSNHDRVYYTPLSSLGFYSVPTSVLQVAVNGVTLRDRDVTVHNTPRASQSDGIIMDSQGLLFYGLLQNSSVVYVNTSQPGGFEKEILLVENDVDLQWPDTFAFDDKGYLYMTTNRMQRYSTNTLDFTEVNFRVARVFTGSRSYLYSTQDKVSSQYPHQVDRSDNQQSPTNLDSDAPDQPVGVRDSELYKHDQPDLYNGDGGTGRNNQMGDGDDLHHHSHQHSNSAAEGSQQQPTSSAPTVNEQLPVVLFLSVLMYNPAVVANVM